MNWKRFIGLKEKDAHGDVERKQPPAIRDDLQTDINQHETQDDRPFTPQLTEQEEHIVKSIAEWSGETVKDLEALDLMTVSHRKPWLLQHDSLSNTVPDTAQGIVWAASRPNPDEAAAEINSLDNITEGIEIVAFDRSGMALIKSYVCFDYTGAEGWDYKSMTQTDALRIVDEYRSSHEAQAGITPGHGDLAPGPEQEGRTFGEAAGLVLATAQDPLNKALRGVGDHLQGQAQQNQADFYHRLGLQDPASLSYSENLDGHQASNKGHENSGPEMEL